MLFWHVKLLPVKMDADSYLPTSASLAGGIIAAL